MSKVRILMVMSNGGISQVYATAPVEMTVRDHDMPADWGDGTGGAQTINVPADQIKVVTEQELQDVLDGMTGDDATHCVVCNAELVEGDGDTCADCRAARDEVVVRAEISGRFFREPDEWVDDWRQATGYSNVELDGGKPDLMDDDIPFKIVKVADLIAEDNIHVNPDDPRF